IADVADLGADLQQVHVHVELVMQIVERGAALPAAVAGRTAEKAGRDEVLLARGAECAGLAFEVRQRDERSQLKTDAHRRHERRGPVERLVKTKIPVHPQVGHALESLNAAELVEVPPELRTVEARVAIPLAKPVEAVSLVGLVALGRILWRAAGK